MLPADDWSTHNPSTQRAFEEVLERACSRRQVLRAGLGSVAALWFAGSAEAKEGPIVGAGGGAGISPSTADRVRVPEGYTAEVLYAWGDPVSDGPAWKPDASNSAADQEQQAGMHHDGMEYFPLDEGRGLLCMNHEYTDDGLLHTDGRANWSAEKVRKSQAAHGVSVIEVQLRDGGWHVVRPSKFARRITAATPMRIAGPAAGDPMMRTGADPEGVRVLGTLNNCAAGRTPWGTYLTCEENWHGYFVHPDRAKSTKQQKRYGIGRGNGYRWNEHDARFDVAREPNESNRFGWVVEIDPRDPKSVPVKRTALGRCRHENAPVVLAADRRVVVYMGDDAQHEYIYKFVSDQPYVEGGPGGELLDRGTLYAACFDEDGGGRWLALKHGSNGLDKLFASQADVCVHARLAGDHVKATPMDRAEWIAVHPTTGETYVALSNNSARKVANAANPRMDNIYGHIVRWRPEGGDHGSDRFAWDLFLLAGDPAQSDPARRGNVKPPESSFGAPDGLHFDPSGRLWIQTDVSSRKIGKGPYEAFGNNQLLVVDPALGRVRRFMTGPKGCEVTGALVTPDGRTLFVNLQHPGEAAGGRGDPNKPDAVSRWPSGKPGARPRSATVVIRRKDGGVVG